MPNSGPSCGKAIPSAKAASRTLPTSTRLPATEAVPQVNRSPVSFDRRNGRVRPIYQGDRQANA